MKKEFLLLVPMFFCSVVSAQLNTFEPGDLIKADDMNENFELIKKELEALSQKVECAIATVTGKWIYAKADVDESDYEIGEITLVADGSLIYKVRTGQDGTNSFQGDYSISEDCLVTGQISLSAGTADFYGWLSDDGQTMPILLDKNYENEYGSGVLSKFNRESSITD